METSNPLAVLWVGRCKIWEYQDVIDPDTFQTSQEEVIIVEDEPCRVSFDPKTIANVVSVASGLPEPTQYIVLFIRPDLEISPGSVIEVTQNGNTTKYKRSGKSAVYTNHQEIRLNLYEDYA